MLDFNRRQHIRLQATIPRRLNDSSAHPLHQNETSRENDSALQPRRAAGFCQRYFMDIFWSELTMPIGVALCFGPAMLVWWLTEGRKPRNEEEPVRIKRKD